MSGNESTQPQKVKAFYGISVTASFFPYTKLFMVHQQQRSATLLQPYFSPSNIMSIPNSCYSVKLRKQFPKQKAQHELPILSSSPEQSSSSTD
jgi:hypothetical protein